MNPEARIFNLPHFPEENGDLTVLQGQGHVPFAISRVFFVRAPADAVRGHHAHRACAQFLVCAAGRVDVRCDNGTTQAEFVLDRPQVGLLIPPGVWAEQIYRIPGSVLTVLCDQPYSETDYIRDYAAFRAYRAERGSPRIK